MSRLIAISNRTAADPGARAGGLAVAVWESLRTSGGAWFGWSGEIVEDGPCELAVSEDEGVTFGVTDLTTEEFDGYYNHYANSVLWPVLHYRVDLASFDAAAFKVYAAVNERVARLVAPQLKSDDIVWVHDYHFLLMGRALRDAGCRQAIGFFLHIPFPPPEIFRAVPEHEQIVRAMAAFSVVGFQSRSDRLNFSRYLIEDCGGVALDDNRIEVFGEVVFVNNYPIGIDPGTFEQASRSDLAREASGRLNRFLGERQLVLGVDRMDYSKGLPERFMAVGKLFDHYPDVEGRVSVTQIAPPSREKVEEYQSLRQELDMLAGRINGDYGDLDWIPLRYLARPYQRDELAGVYRLASVGLVTPLHDGMNLVCKEFVMAQDPKDPGVLVLSEFAGAAEQLDAALIVNPHDADAVAHAIHEGLTMSLDERVERWYSLSDVVQRENIDWWRERFLSDLAADCRQLTDGVLRESLCRQGRTAPATIGRSCIASGLRWHPGRVAGRSGDGATCRGNGCAARAACRSSRRRRCGAQWSGYSRSVTAIAAAHLATRRSWHERLCAW